MATTATNLSIPAPVDDSMEMSSPARQALEDDIDFDDWLPDDGTAQVNDDDRMMDDGDPTRPATATDDMMEDDMQQGGQTEVQEEVMEDSPAHVKHVEDEELIDYSDDELEDEVVEDAAPPDIPERQTETAPTVDQQDVDEEIVRSADDAGLEPPAQDLDEVPAVAEEDVGPVTFGDDNAVPQETTHDVAAESVHQIAEAVNETAGEDVEADIEAEAEEQPTTGEADPTVPAISIDTAVEAPADGPATPTDTGLHAMTVRFHDYQFPLFKSCNQPDGLLKNDNLASLSLGELIQNCRQRLAIKTGENLPEEQDLVLAFDQLGLMLVEDSSAAFEASLDEVLDVYLQLHQNDGTEDIPPFSLTLSLQLKFTSSIFVLKQAAAGGQGMSHFGVTHAGDEENVGEYREGYAEEEYGDDGNQEYDEDYVHVENEGHKEHGEAGQASESNQEQQETDTNDYHEYNEEQQKLDPGQEDYYQEDYQDDFHDNQYCEDQPDEATQLLDEHAHEGDGLQEESVDATHEGQGEARPAMDEANTTSHETPAGEDKNSSTATSTTLLGDDGHDNNGMYKDEDLIDWEDNEDSILTTSSSEHTIRSDEDYTTWLEGDEEDHTGATTVAGEPSDPSEVAVENGTTAATNGIPGQNAQELGSEDFLVDFGENNPDQQELSQQQFHTNDATAEHQHHRDPKNEPADELAEQQDPVQPDHQPGQESGHLQPTSDLFSTDDGAANTHALDQQPPRADEDATLVAPTTIDDDYIDFDEPDDPPPAGSRTPTAKRSFEDLGDDEIDFDSPEPKKQKAS